MSSDTTLQNNYQLAYPGMLPDHPFYKLKVVRDKLLFALISDPKKKIEFFLLQTDKGIAATEELVKKKEIELAKQTALKAENNYTLITYEAKSNKKVLTKKDHESLQQAALKHQEVLKSIIDSVDKQDKKLFETVLYFSEHNAKELEKSKSP